MDINSLRIGRSVDNDIVINEQRVSSHHARLVKTAQGLIIEDLGSRNGVFVNNERVQRKLVRIGDMVQLSQNAMLDWGHPAIECLLSGEGAGVQEDSFTIGRAVGNDMIINDPRISSQHAKIVRTPDGLRIEDVGSQNGIFVSGAKVTSVQIYPGVNITFSHGIQLNWEDTNLRSWLGQEEALVHYRPRKTRNTIAWIVGSIGVIAAIFVIALTVGRDSKIDCSQLTDASGTAYFIDSGTGEEVSMRVVNENNELLEDIQVDFVDGDGFETFIAFDPQGVKPPALRIYSHNSTHEIQMFTSGVFLPIIQEFIPGSEEYESLLLFSHFLDDMRGERDVETSGPGPNVPDNWAYQGIYTQEELERKSQYYLMILTPILGSGPAQISETGGKILDILEVLDLVEVPEQYHSWIIIPSRSESANLAGTMSITMPVGGEWEVIPEPALQTPLSSIAVITDPVSRQQESSFDMTDSSSIQISENNNIILHELAEEVVTSFPWVWHFDFRNESDPSQYCDPGFEYIRALHPYLHETFLREIYNKARDNFSSNWDLYSGYYESTMLVTEIHSISVEVSGSNNAIVTVHCDGNSAWARFDAIFTLSFCITSDGWKCDSYNLSTRDLEY